MVGGRTDWSVRMSRFTVTDWSVRMSRFTNCGMKHRPWRCSHNSSNRQIPLNVFASSTVHATSEHQLRILLHCVKRVESTARLWLYLTARYLSRLSKPVIRRHGSVCLAWFTSSFISRGIRSDVPASSFSGRGNRLHFSFK